MSGFIPYGAAPYGSAVQTSVEGIITGVPASGTPQAIIVQQAAILRASEALGAPQAVLSQSIATITATGASGAPQALLQAPLPVWIEGHGALGPPGAVAWQQFALAQGQGAIGTPQALSHFGYLTRVQGDAAAGTPQGLAHFGYFAWPQAPGALADTQATAFALPAVEDAIPGDVTYYFCKLTGAADGLTDAVLPISNFSVRHRYDGPSYYQITIPSYAYVTAITARPNGEIVLWSETGGVSEELLRGDLGSVRTDRGPRSQSISISGNSDRAASDSKTFLLAEALYASTTFEGESRLRIPPRAGIRPGDFVRYSDLNFQVGEVVWSVAVSPGGMAITMEIVNLPVDAT